MRSDSDTIRMCTLCRSDSDNIRMCRSDSGNIRMFRSDSDSIRMYRSDSDSIRMYVLIVIRQHKNVQVRFRLDRSILVRFRLYTVHIPDYIGISWPDSAFILVHMLFKFKLQYYVHINMLHNHMYMLYSAYTPLMYMI